MSIVRPGRRAPWFALVIPIGLAAWLASRPPFTHWATVDRGVMYRSALLPPDDMKRAVARFGIRTVVNLRPDHDELRRREGEALHEVGVPLVDVPLESATPPTPDQVKTLLAIFDDPARRPVLVHCRHGSIRAGGIEALYRREYMGESANAALSHASRFGYDLVRDAPKISRFVEAYTPRAAAAHVPTGASPPSPAK